MGEGRPIVVFGAGGHGKVVAEIALMRGFDVVAFIDDAKASSGATHLGRPVLTLDGLLAEPGRWPRVVALGIGANEARRQIAVRLRANGFALAPLVHPRATVSASARLGEGVVIAAGAVVSAEAAVEEGAIVNTNAVVEHDCFVGGFAHVGPGSVMCGGSRIGDRGLLGAGAILPVMGAIAAGAVVPPGTVVTGVA